MVSRGCYKKTMICASCSSVTSKRKVKLLSHGLTLCKPKDCSLPWLLSINLLQAEYWRLPFPSVISSPTPGINLGLLPLCRALIIWSHQKALRTERKSYLHGLYELSSDCIGLLVSNPLLQILQVILKCQCSLTLLLPHYYCLEIQFC